VVLFCPVHEGNESRTGLDDVSWDQEGVAEVVASSHRWDFPLYFYLDRLWCLEVNPQVRHHRLLFRVVHHQVSESDDDDVWKTWEEGMRREGRFGRL
jgi:hypothetical protein